MDESEEEGKGKVVNYCDGEGKGKGVGGSNGETIYRFVGDSDGEGEGPKGNVVGGSDVGKVVE